MSCRSASLVYQPRCGTGVSHPTNPHYYYRRFYLDIRRKKAHCSSELFQALKIVWSFCGCHHTTQSVNQVHSLRSYLTQKVVTLRLHYWEMELSNVASCSDASAKHWRLPWANKMLCWAIKSSNLLTKSGKSSREVQAKSGLQWSPQACVGLWLCRPVGPHVSYVQLCSVGSSSSYSWICFNFSPQESCISSATPCFTPLQPNQATNIKMMRTFVLESDPNGPWAIPLHLFRVKCSAYKTLDRKLMACKDVYE